MDIEILAKIKTQDVLDHIRWTPLTRVKGSDLSESGKLQKGSGDEIKDQCTFPYLTADLSIKHVRPADLQPTSYYGLEEGIKRQILLREELKAHDYDNFRLGVGINGIGVKDVSGLIFKFGGVVYTLLPTISEFPIDSRFGDPSRAMINDGHHRMYQGRQEGEHVSTIMINGATTQFYALPNPSGWDDFMVGESVPKFKKAYSSPNPYTNYRNFEHGFVLPERYPILRESGVIMSSPRPHKK